jgi:hypothetical protein
MKHLLFGIALALIVTFGVGWSQSSPVWEYKVESGITEKKINELAVQRWEVVATGNYGGPLAAPYVILKRAK